MLAPSSWIPVPANSDFPLQNLPFGVCSIQGQSARACATIVGDTVIHLGLLEEAGLFADIDDEWTPQTFVQSTLNAFVEHPQSVWSAVRRRLIELLMQPANKDDNNTNNQQQSSFHHDPRLLQNAALQKAAFHPIDQVTLHLPITITEYTDFYSSREHATNVGIMFRGKEQALQPNWLHLPVGYQGRASTVHVSGHSFPRPCGQIVDHNNNKNNSTDSSNIIHGPTKLLDFELEMGTIVGGSHQGSDHSSPLSIDQARKRVFGFVLLNDWSARDIQKFEYVPLGPFTSKNFCTTISPWIITAEALEPWKCPTSAGSQDNPQPLPYLQDDDYSSYNIDLTVAIQTPQQSVPHVVGRSNFKNLYWNAVQQLVHHSVTGCTMRAGDLLGSGTISGSEAGSYGSMLELSWKETKPVLVGEAETRTFLQDGDTVIMKGSGQSIGKGGPRIGFGECTGTILPSTEKKVENPINTERYSKVKLYGFFQSSSTIRVKIVLAAKKIDYEHVEINLRNQEHKAPEYLAKNPLGQVPMLECIDSEDEQIVRITQSMAIIDFLEEAFPLRQSLFPRGTLARTRARQMVEIVNSGTQPLQNKFYLAGLEDYSNGAIRAVDEGRKACERGLAALERLVQEQQSGSSGGPFCMGTFSPTIADVYMVPQLANARGFFGVAVDTICPTLVKIDAECGEHPWFIGAKEKQ